MERQTQIHPFPPIYDASSRVLILGSFPSVKSREQGFYYEHPRNRFWKVLAAVLGEPGPHSAEEKTALLLAHHIALWDVLGSCAIAGSSDASIRDAVPNDLSPILDAAPIRAIFCTGGTAFRCYERFQKKTTGRSARKLPSTSPANARWTQATLIDAWGRALLPELGE